MNTVIAGLIGRRVKVWQGGSDTYYYTEEGTVEAYEHPWLLLRDDAGELIHLTAYHIRMIRQTSVPAPALALAGEGHD